MAKFERSPIGKYDLIRIQRDPHDRRLGRPVGFDAVLPGSLNFTTSLWKFAQDAVKKYGDDTIYYIHAVQES